MCWPRGCGRRLRGHHEIPDGTVQSRGLDGTAQTALSERCVCAHQPEGPLLRTPCCRRSKNVGSSPRVRAAQGGDGISRPGQCAACLAGPVSRRPRRTLTQAQGREPWGAHPASEGGVWAGGPVLSLGPGWCQLSAARAGWAVLSCSLGHCYLPGYTVWGSDYGSPGVPSPMSPGCFPWAHGWGRGGGWVSRPGSECPPVRCALTLPSALKHPCFSPSSSPTPPVF